MRFVFVLMVSAAGLAQDSFTPRERLLLERIEKLEQRLAALEAKAGGATHVVPVAPAEVATTPKANAATVSGIGAGTTINLNLDGYYAYNFNRPFTGMNPLRAYDVSSSGFAINQAGVVIERTADVSAGRRFGGRLDLMFGQATETLQGSPLNERRPEVFRHIFQAYGTVVAPVGKGLTVDFGKWASSFGIEGNYTKDQFNYSRAYWFSFLPFYHTGMRATYPVAKWLNASYWLTNGLNQTEDFNRFKSQAVLLNFVPSARVSANLNYYNGQEQPGFSGQVARGRTHLLDSYITWQASDRWKLAGEADYAVERLNPQSAPRVVFGGAGYARYAFTKRFSLAGRFAYLNDGNGWFTGRDQAVKDATATATFDLADGFQMRWEVRRDWSNVGWFTTADPLRRKREQTTGLIGLIWWFGGKQGAW